MVVVKVNVQELVMMCGEAIEVWGAPAQPCRWHQRRSGYQSLSSAYSVPCQIAFWTYRVLKRDTISSDTIPWPRNDLIVERDFTNSLDIQRFVELGHSSLAIGALPDSLDFGKPRPSSFIAYLRKLVLNGKFPSGVVIYRQRDLIASGSSRSRTGQHKR